MKKEKPYLPEVRDTYTVNEQDLKSYSPTGKTCIKTPNPVKDPVACNNIATSEFDYTDKSLYK